MTIRKRGLPRGWYPEDPLEVKRQVEGWKLKNRGSRGGLAAVVPHAGWYYSGRIAMKTLGELPRACQIVVIAGGHLPKTAPLHMAFEEAFEVPGGWLGARRDLAQHLREEFTLVEDGFIDNTVEIQLPLVHHLWPQAENCLAEGSPLVLGPGGGRISV